MKTWVYVGLTALAAAACDSATAGPNHGFEVHEWGTFTSMQGVSGSSLEGLHHEEEALPSFVHRVVETPVTETHQGKGGFRAVRVSEKMETPVIYFYTDKPMNAEVNVGYSSGVMSEWFPAARHTMKADFGPLDGKAALDVSRVRASHLKWDVELTPRSKTEPAGIPTVSKDDPWSFAREVRSAYVTDKRTRESEHYLFYRGLGRSNIALSVEQKSGGNLVVRNDTGHPIEAAFVLETSPDGARWQRIGSIRKQAGVRIGKVALRDGERVARELKSAVEDALVESGLFRDEAKGMVKTWSRSWFESEGSRIIYIVPRQIVDDMLPLVIRPKPDKIVRTLVGRLEYVRPKVAREVRLAVRDRFATDKASKAKAKARLDRLGRYLEPHLRLILAGENNLAIKKNAEKLLATMLAQP